MFHKATLSYPLYELINKYSKQFVRTRFEAGGGEGGVSQEIGAVDLAAICLI